MTVITVKTAVLVFGPLTEVSLQLTRKNVKAPSFLICNKT